MEQYTSDSMKADSFLDLAKRYTQFDELTPTLLNEFIEKVMVHEGEWINGIRTQQVDIYLSFIGNFELPASEMPVFEALVRKGKKKKKRRNEMTDEQVHKLRERDKVRYAQTVAAKKAEDAQRRAAILPGTSYETLLGEERKEPLAM